MTEIKSKAEILEVLAMKLPNSGFETVEEYRRGLEDEPGKEISGLIYECMEEYASQFKAELSSKEALIGELKEGLEAMNDSLKSMSKRRALSNLETVNHGTIVRLLKLITNKK